MTKIPILCDGNELPLHGPLTACQTHDAAVFDEVLVSADACMFDDNRGPMTWPIAVDDGRFRPAWIDEYVIDFEI